MPITFAVKIYIYIYILIYIYIYIVQLKAYNIFYQSDDLALHSRSQLYLNHDIFNLYYSCNISDSIISYVIKTLYDGKKSLPVVRLHAT